MTTDEKHDVLLFEIAIAKLDVIDLELDLLEAEILELENNIKGRN